MLTPTRLLLKGSIPLHSPYILCSRLLLRTGQLHMQDKTSLGQQAQSCLWVLHTTACMLQTGHLNAAYMNAQGRLKCIPPSSKGAKTIVVPCDAFGEDIPEIKPQLRVIRAT